MPGDSTAAPSLHRRASAQKAGKMYFIWQSLWDELSDNEWHSVADLQQVMLRLNLGVDYRTADHQLRTALMHGFLEREVRSANGRGFTKTITYYRKKNAT